MACGGCLRPCYCGATVLLMRDGSTRDRNIKLDPTPSFEGDGYRLVGTIAVHTSLQVVPFRGPRYQLHACEQTKGAGR